MLRALPAKVALPAVAVAVWCLAAAFPGLADASYLVDRSTSGERLLVRDGTALVIYRKAGKTRRFMAWGAVNARKPSRARRQVEFKFDYAGGYGRYGKPVWQTFTSTCGPYRGPKLRFLVAACTAPDGSHWALQKWTRSKANYGLPDAAPGHGKRELRLSHWTGEIAKLEVYLDWSYNGRWHHMFGRFTYRGQPIYGFKSTPDGEPLDTHGRVIYLDVFNSRIGRGWQRENGFLARRPDGSFCYGLSTHQSYAGIRPPANGERYRVTVRGPGVTPDVSWEGKGLHDFRPGHPDDEAHEARMNALQRRVAGRSNQPCHD
jgi:hypothetical protein